MVALTQRRMLVKMYFGAVRRGQQQRSSALLRLLMCERRVAQERIAHQRFSFARWTDEESRHDFRLEKRACFAWHAVSAYHATSRQERERTRQVPTPSVFGRFPSGLSNIFYYMIGHILSRFEYCLHGDLDRISSRLNSYVQAISNKGSKVEGIWAFIDGTVRATCRSSEGLQQRALYNGHKHKHAIKFQSVVTPDGIIAHLFGSEEDRMHDITLLRKSKLEERLVSDARFSGMLIYNDPAYGRSNAITSPFRGARVFAAQLTVNRSMSKVRTSVE